MLSLLHPKLFNCPSKWWNQQLTNQRTTNFCDVAVEKQHIFGAAAVLGGALVVLGAALPWVPSGQARYSAFETARAVRELDILTSPAQRWAVISLFLPPVVVPLGLILLSVGWRRIGALALALVGLLGLAAGGLTLKFSPDRLIGPVVASVGGLIALCAAIVLIALRSPKPQAAAAR
jgi:hypothetical protein